MRGRDEVFFFFFRYACRIACSCLLSMLFFCSSFFLLRLVFLLVYTVYWSSYQSSCPLLCKFSFLFIQIWFVIQKEQKKMKTHERVVNKRTFIKVILPRSRLEDEDLNTLQYKFCLWLSFLNCKVDTSLGMLKT